MKDCPHDRPSRGARAKPAALDSDSVSDSGSKARLRAQIIAQVRRDKKVVTSQRLLALDIILGEGGVIKPYAVLENYKKLAGKDIAATSVYRLLDFWKDAGVLHKVESLNGFVMCRHLRKSHSPIILACRDTGRIIEVAAPQLWDKVQSLAEANGFEIDNDSIVVTGRIRPLPPTGAGSAAGSGGSLGAPGPDSDPSFSPEP